MPKIKRKPLDFATKYAAMRKTNGICPYCRLDLEYEHELGQRVAFDHIIPISRGGADSVDNLVACCFQCNARKHAKTPFEFFCERMGLRVTWFARFNPELDGVSVPDDMCDLYDDAAWRACFYEVEDGRADDYGLLFELDQMMEVSAREYDEEPDDELEEEYAQ